MMRMQKWKHSILLIGLLMSSVFGGFVGCGAEKEEKKHDIEQTTDATEQAPAQEEEVCEEPKEVKELPPIRAVYLKNSHGEYIFVNLENGTPFVGKLPSQILREDGSVIVQEDVKSGDIYELYGNQILLESYPGKYPGILKMVRVEEQNQAYIQQYQSILDEFCPEPDTTQPPQLSVEYQQPGAVVNETVKQGGYTWERPVEGGAIQAEVVDSMSVLFWSEEQLAKLKIKEAGEFSLHFSYDPQTVKVLRWPIAEREKALNEEQYADGETVRVEQREKEFLFTAEPKHVYEVIGEWAEGTVHYGFRVSTLDQ